MKTLPLLILAVTILTGCATLDVKRSSCCDAQYVSIDVRFEEEKSIVYRIHGLGELSDLNVNEIFTGEASVSASHWLVTSTDFLCPEADGRPAGPPFVWAISATHWEAKQSSADGLYYITINPSVADSNLVFIFDDEGVGQWEYHSMIGLRCKGEAVVRREPN